MHTREKIIRKLQAECHQCNNTLVEFYSEECRVIVNSDTTVDVSSSEAIYIFRHTSPDEGVPVLHYNELSPNKKATDILTNLRVRRIGSRAYYLAFTDPEQLEARSLGTDEENEILDATIALHDGSLKRELSAWANEL